MTNLLVAVQEEKVARAAKAFNDRLRNVNKTCVVRELERARDVAAALVAGAESARSDPLAGAIDVSIAFAVVSSVLDCIAFADCAFADRKRLFELSHSSKPEATVYYKTHSFADAASRDVQLRILQLHNAEMLKTLNDCKHASLFLGMSVSGRAAVPGMLDVAKQVVSLVSEAVQAWGAAA